MKPEIVITIDRGATEDWLNPDGDQDAKQVRQWADQYAAAVQQGMAAAQPGYTVMVDWGNHERIDLQGLGADEDDYALLEGLHLDYEAVCDKLANFDWLEEAAD